MKWQRITLPLPSSSVSGLILNSGFCLCGFFGRSSISMWVSSCFLVSFGFLRSTKTCCQVNWLGDIIPRCECQCVCDGLESHQGSISILHPVFPRICCHPEEGKEVTKSEKKNDC